MAVREAATPQLRNMATIGGNLCQRSRCWYFRGPFLCWLKGGEVCYAKQGENSRHAIFGGGPCYSVHPSDPAVALVALDARVRVQGRRSEALTTVERFILNPNEHNRREVDLRPGELITEVLVPTPPRPSATTATKSRWSATSSSARCSKSRRRANR